MVQDVSACFDFNKYPSILVLETRIAAAVCKRISENHGVYLPPFVVKGKPVYFAVDNIDFNEATPDGANTLHGTIITLFQEKSDDGNSMVEPLFIEPVTKNDTSTSNYDVPLSILPTSKLMKPVDEKFQEFPL